MKKVLYTISRNDCVAEKTYRLELTCTQWSGPEPMKPGQFVGIGIEGKYLRRPIAVADWQDAGQGSGDGSLMLVYKQIGDGTRILTGMKPGERLELLTGLGNGFDRTACKESALLLSGGVGAAPLLGLCKELVSRSKKVTAVLGFNKAEEIVLVEDYRSLGVEPFIATLDGSVGQKGFVTDVVREYGLSADYFYTCGPMPMMRAVCEQLPTDGEASLETRMACGAGFCYGCSIETKNGPRRVCKDGPVFKKDVIFW